MGREKRKRSRVTSEQLAHLERAFQMERSPTAADRRAISEFLGMNERQTQIWFQNRRAKAKVQDGKPSAQTNDAETSAKSSSSPVSSYDIHEDQPVNIIPCNDLTIGTWRRVSSGNSHDLVAYVCNAKQCLNWYIRSNGYGFKMEIPFSTIVDTEYKIIGDHSGIASFVLSHPPIFYLENMPSPLADKSAGRSWKRCSDWTEGHQASQVLRHTVVGSNIHLENVLRSLHP
ncbi:homeobox-domain-containing protein, partial [Pholiota conissans]